MERKIKTLTTGDEENIFGYNLEEMDIEKKERRKKEKSKRKEDNKDGKKIWYGITSLGPDMEVVKTVL